MYFSSLIFLSCVFSSTVFADVDINIRAEIYFQKLKSEHGLEMPTPNPQKLTKMISVAEKLAKRHEGEDFNSPRLLSDRILQVYSADYEKIPNFIFNMDKVVLSENTFSFIVDALKMWTALSPEMQARIFDFLGGVVYYINKDKVAVQFVDEVMALLTVSTTKGQVLLGSLTGVTIAWECYKNIKLAWNGEISWRRCSKNIIDRAAWVVGGIAGAKIGATIGLSVCPVVCPIVGGIGGAWMTSKVAEAVSDRITRKLLDLPKTVALEKAYEFLGVHHTASYDEVMDAYDAKIRELRLDRCGNADLQIKLRNYHQLIIDSMFKDS